jgi:Flp pilus assembly protein TadB
VTAVSKERAQRRAERDRLAAAQAQARARQAQRQARRSRQRRVPSLPRRRRPEGLLARRRRAQNSIIALLVIVAQLFGWLVFHSAMASFALLLLTVLAVPVLVTLVLDRRP